MEHKRFYPIILLGCVSLAVLGGCVPISRPATESHADSHMVVHWSYEGEEGPTHWGELNPDWAQCEIGKSQSPIDLAASKSQDLTNLIFNYQPSKINILNNGHTIQVNYDAGNYIELDGVRYDLLQFHFHAPSEHTIDGELTDAELHLVHKNAEGQLAVVGVLINAGTENPVFQTTWDNLPSEPIEAQSIDAQVNAADFLPATQETYRYMGSLTTPPCTEGVKWNVMVEPIEMSEAQLAAFTAIFERNNRPVQPLDGRALVEDSTL